MGKIGAQWSAEVPAVTANTPVQRVNWGSRSLTRQRVVLAGATVTCGTLLLINVAALIMWGGA